MTGHEIHPSIKLLSPAPKRGCYAMAMSFCLSVRSSVCRQKLSNLQVWFLLPTNGKSYTWAFQRTHSSTPTMTLSDSKPHPRVSLMAAGLIVSTHRGDTLVSDIKFKRGHREILLTGHFGTVVPNGWSRSVRTLLDQSRSVSTLKTVRSVLVHGLLYIQFTGHCSKLINNQPI